MSSAIPFILDAHDTAAGIVSEALAVLLQF
jgi:hypothetical protein